MTSPTLIVKRVLSNTLFTNRQTLNEEKLLFVLCAAECVIENSRVMAEGGSEVCSDITLCQPPGCGRVERERGTQVMMPGELGNISSNLRTV